MVLGKRKRSDSDEIDTIEGSDYNTYSYAFDVFDNPFGFETQKGPDESEKELGEPPMDMADDEDLKVLEEEPEQGEVLWSEDKERYPRCAIYHEDVKKQVRKIEVRTGHHSFRSRSDRPATEDLFTLAARMSGCTLKLASATRKLGIIEQLNQFVLNAAKDRLHRGILSEDSPNSQLFDSQRGERSSPSFS